MLTYQYRVRDSLGAVHQGTLDAETQEEATQKLRRDGFQILQLDEDDAASFLFARRVTRSDVVYATGQLAIMVDTGITLSVALDGLSQQEKNPSWKKILVELKNAVEAGEDFSAALAKYPKLFDKTYVSLVKASEATGTLGTMLDRIALYQRKEIETLSKIRSAMAYPLVMMVVATGVTIFLLTYVLPKFMPLFSKKGMDLPKPTLIMMTLSKYLTEFWYVWLAAIAALVVGFIYGKRTEPGRRILDYIKIYAPIVGPMFRKVTISRSVRTLGTMIASGVPVLESLRLCAEISGNYYYERIWNYVVTQVTAGNEIWESLTGNPLIPPMLVQMINSGEQTGKLDVVLERVSTYYDQEVETSLKTTTSLIEPIMITVMGVVVGGIGMALLLPIFSLSKSPG